MGIWGDGTCYHNFACGEVEQMDGTTINFNCSGGDCLDCNGCCHNGFDDSQTGYDTNECDYIGPGSGHAYQSTNGLDECGVCNGSNARDCNNVCTNHCGDDCSIEDGCGDCVRPENANFRDLGCGCDVNGPVPYYLDEDGDGLGTGSSTNYCTVGGLDCLDTDGDGQGGATCDDGTKLTSSTTGNALPAGWVLNNVDDDSDCNTSLSAWENEFAPDDCGLCPDTSVDVFILKFDGTTATVTYTYWDGTGGDDANTNKDCYDTCLGHAYVDSNCGDNCVSGGTGVSCIQDCNGNWNGENALNACNVCWGPDTGITSNVNGLPSPYNYEYGKDCANTCFGSSVLDDDNNCCLEDLIISWYPDIDEDGTGNNDQAPKSLCNDLSEPYDFNGGGVMYYYTTISDTCDGTIDDCGVCEGGNINKDGCGDCHIGCTQELFDGGETEECDDWNALCSGCKDASAINYDDTLIFNCSGFDDSDNTCCYYENTYLNDTNACNLLTDEENEFASSYYCTTLSADYYLYYENWVLAEEQSEALEGWCEGVGHYDIINDYPEMTLASDAFLGYPSHPYWYEGLTLTKLIEIIQESVDVDLQDYDGFAVWNKNLTQFETFGQFESMCGDWCPFVSLTEMGGGTIGEWLTAEPITEQGLVVAFNLASVSEFVFKWTLPVEE
jgi:hypothetical protein